MDKLKEWDALTAIAGTEHDHLLDTPATWYTDSAGTAHGTTDHASSRHDGTLRDLIDTARHTKGCCSVNAVAGDAGKHAAQTAQDVTASSAEIARLANLATTNASEAYRKAIKTLNSRHQYSPTETAQLEQIRDRAKADAQSDERKAALEEAWLERAARRHPDSPLATISALLDGNMRIHTWHVRNQLLNAEMTDTWTSELTDMLASIEPDGLDILDELDIDEILTHTRTGTALKDAIIAAWHAKAHAAAITGAAWTRAWIAERHASGQEALVIADANTWQYAAPDVHAAWSRHDLDDIALVVPIGVAEGLNLALSGVGLHHSTELAWCPLDTPLPERVLDVIDRLAKDQHGDVESASELVAIATALDRP